jgi:hypothetical protein
MLVWIRAFGTGDSGIVQNVQSVQEVQIVSNLPKQLEPFERKAR